MEIYTFYVPVLSGLAFIISLIFFFAILSLAAHADEKPISKEEAGEPIVAILVAMRNEVENIPDLITSLRLQDYPIEKLQIMLIDDHSDDGTFDVAQGLIQDAPHFQLLKMPTDYKTNLKGKMRVLALGIERLSAEIILVTDADCVLPSGYISRLVRYFDPETGMVGGLTIPEKPGFIPGPPYKNTPFGKWQALDWLFLQVGSHGAARAGRPISILGNNMAFRKKVYEEIGGFEKIGFSVTEDFYLMQAIERTKKWKIKLAGDPELTIFTYPSPTFHAFLSQRTRWVRGGREARPLAYFYSILSTIAHSFIPLLFLSMQYNFVSATAIGLTLGIDFYVLRKTLKTLGLTSLLRHFIPFVIFHFTYILLMYIAIIFPIPVYWKGRRYSSADKSS